MYKKWKSVSALGMAVLLGCLMPMGTMLAAEESTETVQVQNAAPVIDITFNGQNGKYSLGGKIEYIYVNNLDKAFECSVSGEQSVYYYLDKFDKITDNAKEEAELDSRWEGPSSPTRFVLSDNACYVLYVKAVGADEQTTYARSCGVVVDNIAPTIGLDEGKDYPEGTTFKVEDANLDSVKVNEKLVTPDSNGNYQVSANGTSCVIKATDKAKNEKTVSINVTARNPEENGVISANGTYALKAGTPYQLAAGKWQVSGDGTIYQGGSTFYVKEDKDYSFTKR